MMWSTLRKQIPLLMLQVSLCLDSSPPWDAFNALVLALICYLTISSSVSKPDTGIGFVNYVQGTAIGTFAVDGFYLLLLGKPLTKFKYIGEGNRSSPNVWWKKYLNVVCIPHSPRLIGWSHQVKNIPPAPQQPRSLFIFRSALRAVMYTVLFEAGRLYVWYNPAYSPTVIGTQGYIAQCINAAVFIGLTYWLTNAMYFAVAAGSVTIGMHSPRMWPDLYGAWGDAYTVRRFWGRTWHQMLRWLFSPLGKATSTAIGFKRGTLGSSYTQLYVAFFLSGLIHTAGDVVLSHTSTSPRPFFSMQFFLLQGFLITLEDTLIWIARRQGVKGSVWMKVFGYTWVAVWFGWCVSEFVRDVIRAGGGIKEPQADGNPIGSNLVQAMLGPLGFDIGTFAESWFLKP